MKLYIVIVSATFIMLSGMVLLFLQRQAVDVLGLLTTLFTCLAAIATARAAFAASKSASISQQALSSWKQQMALEIELGEMKAIKMAANAWHRYLATNVAADKLTLSELTHWLDERIRYDKAQVIADFQYYVRTLNDKWECVEAAFDKANFTEDPSRVRIPLRQWHNAHISAVKEYNQYLLTHSYQGDLSELLTTIYWVTDWAEQYRSNQSVNATHCDGRGITKKVVQLDNVALRDENMPLHDEITALMSQLNTRIEQQMCKLKCQLD